MRGASSDKVTGCEPFMCFINRLGWGYFFNRGSMISLK